MQTIPETKKSHLWRKVVWHTDPETHPLGPFHSAEIYCCEESNGYAVWYVRKLARDDVRGKAGVENADYLLKYFSKNARDEAIEYAVVIAHSAPTVDKLIEILDTRAAAAQKV